MLKCRFAYIECSRQNIPMNIVSPFVANRNIPLRLYITFDEKRHPSGGDHYQELSHILLPSRWLRFLLIAKQHVPNRIPRCIISLFYQMAVDVLGGRYAAVAEPARDGHRINIVLISTDACVCRKRSD